MINIGIITIFPELIKPSLSCGIVTRALGVSLNVTVFDLRDYASDRRVDDRPFGGGPGMVLLPEVLEKAVLEAKEKIPNAKVIALSPVGKPLKQEVFQEAADLKQSFIFICGRYEGFDQRFIDSMTDDSWSLGDFVLSGGELAALVCVDAIARLLPNVLNTPESSLQESFTTSLLDYPHYTRPRVFNDQEVPSVLLSGNHSSIDTWRSEQAKNLTEKWRPDLLKKDESSS